MGEEIFQDEEVSSEGQGLKPFGTKATGMLQKITQKIYKDFLHQERHNYDEAINKWNDFLSKNAIIPSNSHFFDFPYAAAAAGIMTPDAAKEFVLIPNPVRNGLFAYLLVPRDLAEKAVVLGYIPS